MSKLKSYLMNDVGDGLCVLGKNRRKGLVINCGDRNSGADAGKKLISSLSNSELIDRQNEISLVLSQFQSTHYNGLIYQKNNLDEKDYLKNRNGGRNRKGLFLASVFYPGLPEFDRNREFFNALVSTNLRVFGKKSGEPVADVFTVLKDLFEEDFECYPLFSGDVFAIGDSVFNAHWPPEDLSETQTATSITKSLDHFEEAIEVDRDLLDLFEFYKEQRLFETYRDGTPYDGFQPGYINVDTDVPSETREALDQLNKAANRLCLVFSSGREILFLGNLEKRELNRVVGSLEGDRSLRYKLLIAPDHGTQFSSDMYKIKPDVTLASTGKQLAGNICEEFKQISGRFYSTWVNGDLLVDVNRDPRVVDDL